MGYPISYYLDPGHTQPAPLDDKGNLNLQALKVLVGGQRKLTIYAVNELDHGVQLAARSNDERLKIETGSIPAYGHGEINFTITQPKDSYTPVNATWELEVQIIP